MKYRNKNTGAIINTTSKLGGAWKEYDPSNAKPLKKEEKAEVKKEIPKKKEEVVESGEYTKAEIMKELGALGVEYKKSQTKSELINLMLEKR